MLQTIAGDSVNVNVSRAVSRLKTIFCTFDNTLNPSASQKVSYPFLLVKKNWNYFYHPMADSGKYDFKKELEYQIQVGSKQIPEYPCRSISQSHSELKKALGILGSPWHSISPSFQQYCKDKYIIGVGCEKVSDASWTGLNTKAGDLLTFRLKGANAYINSLIMPSLVGSEMCIRDRYIYHNASNDSGGYC